MCCHVANENAFNKCTDTVHSAATLYDRSTSTADLCACHTWIFHKFTVNMVRVVHGANGVFMVEIVNGTKIRDTSQAINSVPMPTLLLCHCSFVVMTPKKHCNLFRKLVWSWHRLTGWMGDIYLVLLWWILWAPAVARLSTVFNINFYFFSTY